MKIYKWLRRKMKIYFDLCDINDLIIGGHCGCCGKWVTDVIVKRDCRIALCDNCKNLKGE